MYHEERIINGILCWRGTPTGEFIPYSNEQLIGKILQLVESMKNDLKNIGR